MSKKTYKLRKIEMKKFSGDLKEWLAKFQYLVLCMVPGTKAQELVDSYPQSKDNYPKVIEALQQRFGNPKILMQVYVRDLINMVIVNKNKEKMNLASHYYKLESHLRS
ncbi:hypothetical protein CBL_20103 [Carabus blaptoides fortunei]